MFAKQVGKALLWFLMKKHGRFLHKAGREREQSYNRPL